MLTYFDGPRKGGFFIQMTLAEALGAAHQGDCAEDVRRLWGRSHIQKQLTTISQGDIKAALKEYGAWGSKELEDLNQNEQRLIWLAAGNICAEHAAKGTRGVN